MSHLTAQLLAYAQGGKYQPRDLKLDEFVIQSLPILQHGIKPSVRVETRLQRETAVICADRTQIQMILSALMANADEAIREEGVIQITVQNEELDSVFCEKRHRLRPGPHVCLKVKDDGKGMRREEMDKIFDPFFTTKFQGRGMGMAAVYGIVKNHGGWISVDSALNRGTVVSLYFPTVPSNQ
jgi:signal transduction histidine kinase